MNFKSYFLLRVSLLYQPPSLLSVARWSPLMNSTFTKHPSFQFLLIIKVIAGSGVSYALPLSRCIRNTSRYGLQLGLNVYLIRCPVKVYTYCITKCLQTHLDFMPIWNTWSNKLKWVPMTFITFEIKGVCSKMNDGWIPFSWFSFRVLGLYRLTYWDTFKSKK